MNYSYRYYFDLLLALTQKEIKVRYKSSFLGYLWSIANPLSLALVFFLAFKVFMKIPIENYALFLIAGLFPWQWFANSVVGSAGVYLGNASLIKKINFPREFPILALIFHDAFHFIASFPVILLFLFIYKKHPSLEWLYGIPLLFIVHIGLTFSIALVVGSINIFFRDLERLISIFITFLFYFTPVIYSEEMIPAQYRAFIYINPIAPLIISWRNLFLEGCFDFTKWFITLIYSILMLSVAYFIFNKLKWKFAEVI